MIYSNIPLIQHLKHATGLDSDSLKQQYQAYSNKYPEDSQGIAMLLHILKHPEEGCKSKMIFMMTTHLKDRHEKE